MYVDMETSSYHIQVQCSRGPISSIKLALELVDRTVGSLSVITCCIYGEAAPAPAEGLHSPVGETVPITVITKA